MRVAHEWPEIADELMFQTADDVGFHLVFGGASGDVGLAGSVVLHPYVHRPAERAVRLLVAATVEPIQSEHDWAVTGKDQRLGGSVSPDASWSASGVSSSLA